MDALFPSTVFASALVIGAVVAACVVFSVIMVLSDDRRRVLLGLFSHNVTVFIIPLFILFAYIVLIWGVNILTR
jgi:hypothetical protein